MNSNGIDVGNNKRIQIKDYYGDVSGRIENSDSTNNSLRIDVDPDDSGASSVFLVRIDGNELVRLNHNGKFGIGMNDPAATLHVGGGADTSPQVRIQRTSGYNNAWKIYQSHYAASDYGTLFLQPTLATTPNVEITNAAGDMAMRVDTDTCVIRVNSGVGIRFAYSTTSAVLDDYEEGTWIPTFNSTGATFYYNHQYGHYQKVGNTVHVSFYITLVASGNTVTGTTSNTLHINVPFTATNSTRYEAACCFSMIYKFNLNGDGNDILLTGRLYQNNSKIDLLMQQDDDGGYAYTAVKADKNSCGLAGSITYKVDS